MEDNFKRHTINLMQKQAFSLWRKKLVMKMCKAIESIDETLVLCVFGLLTGQHPISGLKKEILDSLPWDTAKSFINEELIMERIDISPYQSWKKNFYHTFKKFHQLPSHFSIDDAESWKKVQCICNQDVEDQAGTLIDQGQDEQEMAVEEAMEEQMISEEEEKTDEEIIPQRMVQQERKRKRKKTVKTKRRKPRLGSNEHVDVQESIQFEEEPANQIVEAEVQESQVSIQQQAKPIVEAEVDSSHSSLNQVSQESKLDDEESNEEDFNKNQESQMQVEPQMRGEKEFDINDPEQVMELLLNHIFEFLKFASSMGDEFKEIKNMVLWTYLKRKYKIINY